MRKLSHKGGEATRSKLDSPSRRAETRTQGLGSISALTTTTWHLHTVPHVKSAGPTVKDLVPPVHSCIDLLKALDLCQPQFICKMGFSFVANYEVLYTGWDGH